MSKPRERNGFDLVTVPPDDRCGHGQRVQNRFFRRFDGRRDERIQMRVCKVSQGISRLLRIMGNDIGRREGENEVAAAMASC